MKTLYFFFAFVAASLSRSGAESDRHEIGWSLIAAPSKLIYRVGEQVTISIVAINESFNEQEAFESLHGLLFTVRRNGKENVDRRSERDRSIPSMVGGFVRKIPIRCGLRLEKDLNEDFDLTRPGRYTVEVRRRANNGPIDFHTERKDSVLAAGSGPWISTVTEFTISKGK